MKARAAPATYSFLHKIFCFEPSGSGPGNFRQSG
jgi:hypothetical protein